MKRLFSIILALTLTACAQFGLQTPDTFAKREAAAIVTVQTVSDLATAGVTSGKLSKADATNVATASRSALQAIDVADQLHATNPQAGEDKLASTLAILTALQSYLATKGVK